MKLELKHLAPYLPYGLMVMDCEHDVNSIELVEGINKSEYITNIDMLAFKDSKPILRPLSNLTEEQYAELDLNHNFSIVRFSDLEKDPTRYPYTIVQKLIEWHFDVFGLIDKGLAIDINTLEP